MPARKKAIKMPPAILKTGEKINAAFTDICNLLRAIAPKGLIGFYDMSVHFSPDNNGEYQDGDYQSINVFMTANSAEQEIAIMDEFAVTTGRKLTKKLVSYDSPSGRCLVTRNFVEETDSTPNCRQVFIKICEDMSPEEKVKELEKAKQAIEELREIL